MRAQTREMGMSSTLSPGAGTARLRFAKAPWLGGVGMLGLAALLAGCKSETAAKQEEAVRPVKVAIVESAPEARTLSYAGVVRPRIESARGFRVSGKITERLISVGDRVLVDQTIARLDETDLKLAELSARAAVAAAASRRDVASDNLERAKKPARLPVVLTESELRNVLAHLDGRNWLMVNASTQSFSVRTRRTRQTSTAQTAPRLPPTPIRKFGSINYRPLTTHSI